MRLLGSFLSLFLFQHVAADHCLICDYVGFADSEDIALSMLDGSGTNAPICASVQVEKFTAPSATLNFAKAQYPTISDKTYCIAQFFIYRAKDTSKFVYGVKRTASESTVTAGRIDIDGYDGVKGYQYALAREGSADANKIWGRKAYIADVTNQAATTDTNYNSYGGNPIFKRRGRFYGICEAGVAHNGCRVSTGSPTVFPFAGQVLADSEIPCEGWTVSSVCNLADRLADCILENAEAIPSTTDHCTVMSAANTLAVLFMGDGREDEPASTVTAVSTTTVQETAYTRCLVCHDSQEFSTPPSTSNQITMGCWNPSGSTIFATDDEATMDPRQYCQPANGLCTTTTWQYSTRDKAGTTTSHWVGVERGCSAATFTTETAPTYTATGNTYNFKRALSSTTAYVRYLPATNTASKAKDNAKYPDADVSNNIPVAVFTTASAATAQTALAETAFKSDGVSAGLLVALVPQFMSVDGNGKPDVPTTTLQDELECLSCVTPIRNTDSTNTCVTAKASGRVMCKTLSCQAITATYRLGSESTEVYYYAKRGCTADPEDGVVEGEQDPADSAVTPEGWTGIKQYNQRSTTAVGNTARTSTISIAKIFDCYSCESSFSATVLGADPVEPKYDDIKEKDTSLCWETFEPQTDSSVISTGSSGSCLGNCFASAYKYKAAAGTGTTTYNWYINRGCATDITSVATGTSQSNLIYGVTLTNYVCTFQNGTLCNGRIKAYDTTLEVQTQNVRALQCFECESPAGNADVTDACYSIVSTAKATECPDTTYTSCYATEIAYNTTATESVFVMKRGCAKGNVADSTELVEGLTNVNAVTSYCSSSSCNKVIGKATGLVIGIAESNDVIIEDDAEVVEEPGSDFRMTILSLPILLLSIIFH